MRKQKAVEAMKATEAPPRLLRRETGFRLPVDQISKLDLLVGLSQGRKKRSQLVMEAIDEFLAARLGRLAA